ncbi:MAG: DUF222 domain-containing protein [Actinomycetota bacterium]
MSAQFTTDQLVTALDQLHGVGNAAKLEFLRLLDHLDESEGWREDGAASLVGWVSYRYAMTWHAATEHVATMRALRDLPAIASAFGTGTICWESLVELCTFVSPEKDDEWADRASRISAAEVKAHARTARRITREHAARTQNRRYVWASWDPRGEFLRLHGLIPGADGALLKKALDRLADQLGPGSDGAFAPYGQRMADALVELAATRIAEDSDPDRANVVVHIDARELASLDGTGRVENTVVSSEIVRRLTCDARIEVVARDGGVAIGIGRTSRTVPSRIRRHLNERDGGCVVCGRRAGCHAHHVKHWAHGGRTDLENLVLLCRRCHRSVHESGFGLARDRFGRVRLIRPDRRPVSNRPARLRPDIRERMLGPVRAPAPALRC